MPAEMLNNLASAMPSSNDAVAPDGPPKGSISLATELKRWKFALALPIIGIDILPKHAQSCPQCQKPYSSEFEVAGKSFGHEAAAVLPCRCVIGFHCAREWLSPHECGFTSCPICGQEFAEMAEESEPHAQAPSDSAWSNFLDTTRDLLPHGKPEGNEQKPNQITPLTTATNIAMDEHRPFPSIGEILTSDLPIPIFTTLKKPEILVTTPEGEITSDYETSKSKHISNSDTADTFTHETVRTISEIEYRALNQQSRSSDAAVAAVKVADLIAKR